MARNGRNDRSSDNIRSKVAQLEADQRNIRSEVHTLRQEVHQGFRDIRDALGDIAERSAQRPTNWGVIASFVGVGCTIFLLSITPVVWFSVENHRGIEEQQKTIVDLLVAVQSLQSEASCQDEIVQRFIQPEMRELNSQHRGSVSTSLKLNEKAMTAVHELREEMLRKEPKP